VSCLGHAPRADALSDPNPDVPLHS
jgi:hypothetical protein